MIYLFMLLLCNSFFKGYYSAVYTLYAVQSCPIVDEAKLSPPFLTPLVTLQTV